jgi:exodeoxyribonuclease V alpha subunit
MEKTAPQRVRAGISFALQTAMDEGHCGLPIDQLTGLAERLLEVDAEIVRSAIHHEIAGSRGNLLGAVGPPSLLLIVIANVRTLISNPSKLPMAGRSGLRPS